MVLLLRSVEKFGRESPVPILKHTGFVPTCHSSPYHGKMAVVAVAVVNEFGAELGLGADPCADGKRYTDIGLSLSGKQSDD